MPTNATAVPAVLGHDIDSLMFDGEEWKLICSCGWETWGRTDEWYTLERRRRGPFHRFLIWKGRRG